MKHRVRKEKKTKQVDDDDDDVKKTPEFWTFFMSVLMWAFIATVYFYWHVIKEFLPLDLIGNQYSDALNVQASDCWHWPLPPHVHVTQSAAPIILHRAQATVILYAPCPLGHFVHIAVESAPLAHEWRYVQSDTQMKLVVFHHEEEPVVLQDVFQSRGTLFAELSSVVTPPLGLHLSSVATPVGHPGAHLPLHEVAYANQQVVTFLPEPVLDADGFDRKYRPMLRALKSNLLGACILTYILPQMYSGSVARELGVASFPKVVVQRRYPDHLVTYTGEMSEHSVGQFLREVLYSPRP